MLIPVVPVPSPIERVEQVYPEQVVKGVLVHAHGPTEDLCNRYCHLVVDVDEACE